MSVFFKEGDKIFYTYSTYLVGLGRFRTIFILFDITPFGRGRDGPAGFNRAPISSPGRPEALGRDCSWLETGRARVFSFEY